MVRRARLSPLTLSGWPTTHSRVNAGVKAELRTAPGWRLEFHIGVATPQAVGRRHVGPIHSTYLSSQILGPWTTLGKYEIPTYRECQQLTLNAGAQANMLAQVTLNQSLIKFAASTDQRFVQSIARGDRALIYST